MTYQIPLMFEHYITKDVAKIPGGMIKHITWMGVVCRITEAGSILSPADYWHNPN